MASPPALTGSAVLRLSQSSRLSNGRLVVGDPAAARIIEFPAELRPILESLERGTRYDDLLDQRSVLGLSGHADGAIANLLASGLVAVQQSVVAELGGRLKPVLARRSSLAEALAKRSPYRMSPPTLANSFACALRGFAASLATMLVVFFSGFVAFGVFSVNDPLGPSAALGYASQVSLAMLIVFVTVVAAHEIGHLATARILGLPVLSLYWRVGCAGVLLASTDRRLATAASLSAGAITGLGALGFLLLTASLAWPPHLAPTARFWIQIWALVAAVWQLLVLTPLASDGRQVWRQLVNR